MLPSPRLKFEPKALKTWVFARSIPLFPKILKYYALSAEFLLKSAFSSQSFPKYCQNWTIFKLLYLGNK